MLLSELEKGTLRFHSVDIEQETYNTNIVCEQLSGRRLIVNPTIFDKKIKPDLDRKKTKIKYDFGYLYLTVKREYITKGQYIFTKNKGPVLYDDSLDNNNFIYSRASIIVASNNPNLNKNCVLGLPDSLVDMWLTKEKVINSVYCQPNMTQAYFNGVKIGNLFIEANDKITAYDQHNQKILDNDDKEKLVYLPTSDKNGNIKPIFLNDSFSFTEIDLLINKINYTYDITIDDNFVLKTLSNKFV